MKFKYLGLMAFFILQGAWAQLEGCGKFTFKGRPQILNKEAVLIINEGSTSEMIFKIAPREVARIAPYLKIMTIGELHIGKVTGPRSGIIDRFTNLDYSAPDPVNTTLHSFLRTLKKEKCR